jgi:rhodanese-related sulfurtransferase
MKGCELCGKPTKSHTAGEIAICHSCFSEDGDIARSLLAEAEGKAKEEDEIEEVFEQLPKHGAEGAFYTDFKAIYDALRDSVDEMRDTTPPPDKVIEELRDLLSDPYRVAYPEGHTALHAAETTTSVYCRTGRRSYHATELVDRRRDRDPCKPHRRGKD